MTQICKFIKYAIFCLYLTIKSVETVYEILYGAINTIWWLKERIEGSWFAWCAPGVPKMTNKVTKCCCEWPFLPLFGIYSYGIHPKHIFFGYKLYWWPQRSHNTRRIIVSELLDLPFSRYSEFSMLRPANLWQKIIKYWFLTKLVS